MKPTLLWQNPDTTVAFNAQDITLLSDDYDYLTIEVNGYNDGDSSEIYLFKTYKGKPTTIWHGYSTPSGARITERTLSFNSNTSIHITDVKTSTGSSQSTPDQRGLIPAKIYGHKGIMF